LGDHQNLIFISNDTAAYFDVEANSFYRITGNYSVSEGTGLSVAGFYVMPWVLDTAVTDVLTSGLYEGTDKFQITTIFTSTTAQKLRILPFAFSVGVSYNLTITKLSNVKTVPQVLDEAQEFTTFDMPYYDSADFGALPIVVMGDGSLIGNPEELPEQIYHAVARKVHLNQGDVLDITFSHSIGESVGYIFLYEKDGNKYNKIGEIGYGEDESGLVLTNPNIVYQADREIDLYIIGTTLYYFPIPYDDGYYTMSIFIPSAGIAALTQKGNIQIAPNPVRDKVTVTDLSGNETVSILDVGGRTVFSQAVAGKSLAMNVSHLNSGVYLLRIASPNGVYATKLIKQ
jgi:hypothetical protein